jgi:hypothetical protein
MWFFDLDATVPGDDTLYALSTVGNSLVKYTNNGTAWVASGSITATNVQNVTGIVNGTSVNLFLTSPTTLFSLTDTSGYAGSINGTLNSIATAGTNTGFRGIGLFEPLPEPSCSMLGLSSLALVLRRRRSV